MTILNSNYQIETDTATGMAVITITGRCTSDEAAAIEGGCCRRYSLNPIPNTSNVVFKSLNGTLPVITSITPTTTGRTYTCVKVDGRANPFAAIQIGGTLSGQKILRYMKKYQEVVSVA